MIAMKIKRVETYPLFHRLKEPYGDANGLKHFRECFLIRITTESGLTGWGECIDWLPTLKVLFEQRIIPFLIGKKVTEREQIVQTVKSWHKRASSGISMALTEILASASQLSVCELWGGALRRKIPLYASFQSYTAYSDWIGISVQRVESAAQQGFSRMKIKVGARPYEEDLKHVTCVQKAVGGHAKIAIDANQSYDLGTAKRWFRPLQQWDNLLWFEEPLPTDQVHEYAMLRTRSPIPLAGGENIKDATQFIPLIRQSALDMIQPDVMHHTSLDAFRSTLFMGREFGLRCSPHTYDGAFSRLYAIFAQACLPPWSKMQGDDIEPVEWDVMENPFTSLLSLHPEQGQINVPTGIGIGVEVDMDRIHAQLWDGTPY
jgi:D-galactarolactone cycloisomerase